ncbi:DUF2950 family protein [Sedimentitalea todarodis]|uniref:DUF2950 family protein n=1 Tax=Sedimentitalea todarodis TaxID=1631240 RepID=A0ABU3VC51_9RHOB|nr:DUF2950 family protein [Sedimentitalea todarodis]MDU9003737.1 DUF2950 family protein [Sedimentitalea todarodis]
MKKFLLSGLAATMVSTTPLLAEPAVYATPHDALMALIDAVSAQDRDAVLAVFGPENADLVTTGNAAEDQRNRLEVLQMYGEGYRMEPQNDAEIVIALGADDWPFPVPLARTDAGWAFDAEAGRAEIQNREIGGNELEIIDLMDAYGDVQAAFRLVDQNGDGVMEFARRIISDADARDGLFWPGVDSPIGANLARAAVDGFSDGEVDYEPDPYQGYYFRILTGQTDAAPGGAMEYIINNHMLAGHALLAVPSAYGETGFHSFMVSENGIILEADLGRDTLDIAADMTMYDPGEGWSPISE